MPGGFIGRPRRPEPCHFLRLTFFASKGPRPGRFASAVLALAHLFAPLYPRRLVLANRARPLFGSMKCVITMP
jgi:hypothetical protein